MISGVLVRRIVHSPIGFAIEHLLICLLNGGQATISLTQVKLHRWKQTLHRFRAVIRPPRKHVHEVELQVGGP